MCCLDVVESTDPLALAALLLAGVTPPLIPTQVGLVCLPVTAETGGVWCGLHSLPHDALSNTQLSFTNLVACDDNTHSMPFYILIFESTDL